MLLALQVDESRAKLRADTAAAQETTQEAAAQLLEQEAALGSAKEQQDAYERQLKAMAKERKQALEARAKVEADVSEAEAALECGESRLRLCWLHVGLAAVQIGRVYTFQASQPAGVIWWVSAGHMTRRTACFVWCVTAVLGLLAAEGAASKAQQEMERLQQQVATVEQQLEAAKETAAQRKAAERDVESNLEDAKAQLQVGGRVNTGKLA